MVRILLLILLVVLLLPYLLTPLYRTGHPVSTLMAWRWLRGAQVMRPWTDFRLRPFRRDTFAARGGPAGGHPAQSGQAQRPQSRPRRAAPGRDLYGAGERGSAMLERKSCFLSQFLAVLTATRPSFTPPHPL